MGIYIKDMTLPDDCSWCPLETDYVTCGYYSCRQDGMRESDYEKRRDDCPLVEIPPHGRLIDADALKARLFPEKIDGIKTSISVSCMKLVIDDAPTVIEAEDGDGNVR